MAISWRWLSLLTLAFAASGCVGLGGRARLQGFGGAGDLGLSELAPQLLEFDVVYVGELHGDATGHAWMRALLPELLAAAQARDRDLVLSLEMFERDVQESLDAYLAGKLGEAEFLAASQPWPNYAAAYRPLIEWAKRNLVPVLAANVPRRVSARVAREGTSALNTSLYAARSIDLRPGPYRDRVLAVYATAPRSGDDLAEPVEPNHPIEPTQLERYFAACALKDDTMAESIADRALAERARHGTWPLTLHLCSRSRCLGGLGIPERVKSRVPELKQTWICMLEADEPEPFPSAAAVSWLLRLP